MAEDWPYNSDVPRVGTPTTMRCPFCGGECRDHHGYGWRCQDCHATGPGVTCPPLPAPELATAATADG